MNLQFECFVVGVEQGDVDMDPPLHFPLHAKVKDLLRTVRSLDLRLPGEVL